MILSLGIGIVATIIVYMALTGSLDQPTINRIPIPPEAAISIVLAQKNSMHLSPKDFAVGYVYIKGNGEFYESNANSNSIGQYLVLQLPRLVGETILHGKFKIRKMAQHILLSTLMVT